jgi:hypothetical protein
VPNYTIRVQLVANPSEPVYEDLHARMEKGGFLRNVRGVTPGSQQADFALPHATYFGASDANVERVRDWAGDHAKAAWGANIVFVSQSETWAWGRF